jgi:Ca2+-binding RTX toxin-like protein
VTIEQDREQLLLELVNRARMDPVGEGARYGVTNLNAGVTLAKDQIDASSKQVLAQSSMLDSSADVQTAYLLTNDLFQHEGPGTPAERPADRMAAAGYGVKNSDGTYSFGSGENLAWTGTTGTLDLNAAVLELHKQWMQSSHHRPNVLRESFEEVGLSMAYDASYSPTGPSFKAFLGTQNFGYKTDTDVFVTGVSYNDTVLNDDFYSIGEGKAGRTVQLLNGTTNVGNTTTSAPGGYGIKTAFKGNVEVVWSGGDLSADAGVIVNLGALNVKVDLTDNNTIETNDTATITRNAVNLTLLGIDNIDGTGTAAGNVIKGNKGNNTLNGLGGADTIDGGNGNDRLVGGDGADNLQGGQGDDTAVFSGARADYQVSYIAATQTLNLKAADGTVDSVSGVEFFEFSNQTLTVAQLQATATIPVTVSASAAVASIKEGDVGLTTMTFKVKLSSASAGSTLNYTIAGSGLNPANGDDLSGALTGTLTFAAGELEKTVTISVKGDVTFEANEDVTLTLSNPSTALTLAVASATTTILNNDLAPVLVNGGDLTNDVLVGTAKVDILSGFGGDDSLDGKAGIDTMIGGNGHDKYFIDNLGDIADETGTDGIDTINAAFNFSLLGNSQLKGDFENLTLTGKALTGSGTTGDNILIGNKSANILVGLAGADRLDGAKGTDTMRGGAGDDTYVVDSAKDIIDEVSDGANGTDTVLASSSYDIRQRVALTGDVENLTLVGKKALVGTGNELSNSLIGSEGKNTLIGNGGDDFLNGGLGNDTLFGGTGADFFIFTGANFGKDIVKDFEDGSDHVQIANAVDFAALTIAGNDTTAVTVTFAGQTVTLNAATAIHLTADDFIFN